MVVSSSSAIPQHNATSPSQPWSSISTPVSPPSYLPTTSGPSIPVPSILSPVTPSQSSANSSALSWGTPVPALQGQNNFPPLSAVIALLVSERPGVQWNLVMCWLWPEAKSRAKPGQKKPSQARPREWPQLAFGLA